MFFPRVNNARFLQRRNVTGVVSAGTLANEKGGKIARGKHPSLASTFTFTSERHRTFAECIFFVLSEKTRLQRIIIRLVGIFIHLHISFNTLQRNSLNITEKGQKNRRHYDEIEGVLEERLHIHSLKYSANLQKSPCYAAPAIPSLTTKTSSNDAIK